MGVVSKAPSQSECPHRSESNPQTSPCLFWLPFGLTPTTMLYTAPRDLRSRVQQRPGLLAATGPRLNANVDELTAVACENLQNGFSLDCVDASQAWYSILDACV